MLESIRRRLTLGYVGIFALILVLVGAVVVVSFFERVNAQQDELLKQKAESTYDWVQTLLHRYYDGTLDRGGPPGPIQNSLDSDIGAVALVLPDGAGSDSMVLDSSYWSSSLGLPYERLAQRAVQEGSTIAKTVQGPGGEEVRVVSVPVTGREGEVGVVQTARSRREVWETVSSLILVLVPVSLGGLLLAGIGGLYMSRRAMQPVRDSFRRQRTFIADASHELKTPLALIKINAEVMERDPTNPENKEIFKDQLSEIDRMDALLSDLLVLARLDAGRLDVENKPFDLATVAAEATGRFLARAAEEGIRLEVEVPEELSARGDPGRTEQILAALLDNAIRYTPKGGTITVSGHPHGNGVEAEVTDTGAGISPEHLPRIFDRFYRAEAARTRKGGGTGLGLAIARDLARAQHGDLSASNKPDGGASFTLRLPAGL
jgi:signal transduction histidine kinase